MPLKLDVKCGEKLIINGTVLENVGPNAKLLVHNMAAILREKEILTQEEASTPASRVYFALQCAYIFPESRNEHLKNFGKLLKDYVTACPSARDIGQKLADLANDGAYYNCMKVARSLIAHEIKTLDEFQSGIEKLNDLAADADEENTEIETEQNRSLVDETTG